MTLTKRGRERLYTDVIEKIKGIKNIVYFYNNKNASIKAYVNEVRKEYNQEDVEFDKVYSDLLDRVIDQFK